MTLKLRMSSDWHLEFCGEDEIPWHLDTYMLPPLDSDKDSILVMAGDLSTAGQLWRYTTAMDHVAPRFKYVLITLGNHDYYHGSLKDAHLLAHQAVRHHKNVILDNFEQVPFKLFGDTRENSIWMATLWTDFNRGNPIDMQIAARNMADYRCIGSLQDPKIKTTPEQIMTINNVMVCNLFAGIKKGDVVITHHLPSFSCVDPKYAGDKLNAAFASNYDEQIMDTKPAIWCWGHSHVTYDAMLGDTRMLSNAFGYGRHENKEYKKEFIIEV